MPDKRMTFLKAFPGLNLPREIRDLMEGVTVTRLAINQARNRLHVYITSENWIKKQYIYEVEDAIAGQIFENVTMEVKIVERFVLSSQYTPKNFYKYYRSSMLLELKEVSPLLHQMFLHTNLEFDGNTIYAGIPETIISRERKNQLVEYLDKIFATSPRPTQKVSLRRMTSASGIRSTMSLERTRAGEKSTRRIRKNSRNFRMPRKRNTVSRRHLSRATRMSFSERESARNRRRSPTSGKTRMKWSSAAASSAVRAGRPETERLF